MVTNLFIAGLVGVLVLLAERFHARRMHALRRLAFGPEGHAAAWTFLAPWVRALGVVLLVFGSLTLLDYEPAPGRQRLPSKASKQILICLDVSPSMRIPDAGPDLPRMKRSRWAGEAIEPLLRTIGTQYANDTRFSVVAFYTSAIPVIRETYDKEVVLNLFDDMSLDHAFLPGTTDLQGGVNEALKFARGWARNSATLVVISDGDSDAGLSSLLPTPPSIAQTFVLGVGDPRSPTEINGHSSRQDTASLLLLATKLGGTYFDCNRSKAPPLATTGLRMRSPQAMTPAIERRIGLAAIGAGGALVGLIGAALLAFGRRTKSVAFDLPLSFKEKHA
ncbi:MAG: VWA domain-containing protein [Phycisphaerales bacterium]|nr:VWA domain-containing protein [Phycisphaerales bacterium]